MKPGAVIVDVAIDQGGCIETIHETTHDDPVYEVHGVLHYAVGNMPGAVPHTSTYALTNATLPYLLEVAMHGPAGGCRRGPGAGARRQHRRRPGHQRPGRRVPRHALHRPARCAELTRRRPSVSRMPTLVSELDLPEISADGSIRDSAAPASDGVGATTTGWFATCSATPCLHYDDVTAILRDKRWHSAVSKHPAN